MNSKVIVLYLFTLFVNSNAFIMPLNPISGVKQLDMKKTTSDSDEIRSLVFQPTKRDITNISNLETLDYVRTQTDKVILVTGSGCRSCIQFKKKFKSLKEEYPGVNIFEMSLNDLDVDYKTRIEIMKYSSSMGIRLLPTVIIEKNGEVKKLTGVKTNYEEIEKLMSEL
jgi:thiol-disulfide isomerase/thioredoxin